MKKWMYSFIAFAITLNVASAKSTLKHLTFEQTHNSEFVKKIENKTKIKTYKSEMGKSISEGMHLMIGTPKGHLNEMSGTSALGTTETLAAGGKLFLKKGECFETLILGKPLNIVNLNNALNVEDPQKVPTNFEGKEVIVKSIWTVKSGKKDQELKVYVILEDPNGKAFGLNKYLSITNLEESLQIGEILN